MIIIFWSLRAKNDFDRVYRYWEERNGSNTYSEKILDETLRITNLLRDQNKIGLRNNRKNLHRVLILENYSLTYQITINEIKVVSFFDNRQDPKKHIFN